MTRAIMIVVAVLAVAVLGLGYASYTQAKKNGRLEQTLDQVNAANKEWAEAFNELERSLEERQTRLDEFVLRDHNRQKVNKEKEQLFRLEIDKLKADNHELKELLESRIPASVLSRLCEGGYAVSGVCEGLLPTP